MDISISNDTIIGNGHDPRSRLERRRKKEDPATLGVKDKVSKDRNDFPIECTVNDRIISGVISWIKKERESPF